MPSTTLVACERCEELPTSLCYFSVDNYGLTAAVHLCRKCAPLVSHNRLTRQGLDERGWRVGYTTLSARPRRLETDPRWKHRPSLQHEIITTDALGSDDYTGSGVVSVAVNDDMLMAVVDHPAVIIRFRVLN